jgi:arylsulfatase
LLKGKPVFTYNLLQLLQPRWAGEQSLTQGKHTIVFDFAYDGPGIAKSGTGVLKVDGQEVAKLTTPKTIPFLMPADESFDIGVDTRTGVNDLDYKVPFRFNGTIDKLTFKLGPTQLAEEEHAKIQLAMAVAND